MRGRVLLVASLLLVPGMATTAAGSGSDEMLILTLDTWPPPDGLEHALSLQGVQVTGAFDAAHALLVEAPPGSMATLDGMPEVARVVHDEPLEPMLASSKPAVGLTSNMRTAGLTGAGVNVALIDSGVDPEHPGLSGPLAAQFAIGEDGVQEGTEDVSKHGTHVAGILVGTGEEAKPDRGDVSGMAPGAGMVSLDISSQFTTSNALRAFEWVYENHERYDVHVVANAWGRQRDPAAYEPDDPVIRASNSLVGEGLTVVFSAGNGGPDASQMTLEGTNPNVITVGASDDDGNVESYSSRGPIYQDGEQVNWTKPDLVAPGSHIVSTRPTNGTTGDYVMMNGTSMAAPHVAGAAALLLSLHPDLTPQQVKGLLQDSARDVEADGVDPLSGYGMLDVSGAIQLLEQASDQVRERSETTTESGELTGPSQAGAVLQQASVEHRDRFELTVPENATEIETTVTWDGRSKLELRLIDPSGDVAQRALVERQEVIRVEEPREGGWTVELEPDGLSQGSYRAEFTVTWLEHSDGIEIPKAAQNTGTGSFPSTGSTLDPFGPSWIPGIPNIVPMLAGGLLTTVMVVGRLRDDDEDEERYERIDR